MAPSLLDRFRRRSETHSAEEPVEGALPTFITIGCMKGGTSALHGYLREHPQVGMSKPKETNFFSKPEGHDLAWYRSRFTEPGAQQGESSPNYTKRHLFGGVVEQMHALLPDIRLIYLVRDPIDRAISHFLHNVHKARVSRDEFEAYFSDLDNPALLTSRYHWQIEPFVEAYGLDRLFVASSEELRDDRAATLVRIFDFIGVDPDFTSPKFDVERHVTSKKLQDVGESVEKPTLSPQQHQAIADHLRPDIDRFRALVGQDFAHWSV
ncbi:sulfotransferase family protein [Aeromicrobium sp.]|uniref:sulfotransferase family protein n=1 Tax=Aeromicrobium sp. TaxID=1871063 RepID=UPI003D6A2748